MLELRDMRDMRDVGSECDRCRDARVPITSSLGGHTNEHTVSFWMQTPAGFQVEYGHGGRRAQGSTTPAMRLGRAPNGSVAWTPSVRWCASMRHSAKSSAASRHA